LEIELEKYHRRYFSLIKPNLIISYKDFILNEDLLKLIIDKIGLNYSDSIRSYDLNQDTKFFGSSSIRKFNTLIYKEIKDNDIVEKVNLIIKKDKTISGLKLFFESIPNPEIYEIPKQLKFNKLYLQVHHFYTTSIKKLKSIFVRI
jgi:hypothetical protein